MEGDEHTDRLMMMNAETGDCWDLGEGREPAWSPSEDKVAYSDYGAIWVVPVNPQTCEQAGPPVKLAPPAGNYGASWPTWSPGGSYVAYQAYAYTSNKGRSIVYRICKVKADGSEPTEYLADGQYPEWSPM